MSSVAQLLLTWFDQHGRKNLPWQIPRTPYRVWLSEIMLQQTQVATVIAYFERFVRELPTLAALAAASQDQVLALWSGLGYYTRARNLHRAAKICMERYAGELPREFAALADLPGIGRSTAGAILAQAHGLRFAILDGNVKRVLTRLHGIYGWPGALSVQKELWKLSEDHTPPHRVADYTQAIMDLGAMLCTRTRPRCDRCPLSAICVAYRDQLTVELPQRKPARVRPTRSTTMLIVRDRNGRIWLERRPPVGVWAQLWSLPEALPSKHAPELPECSGTIKLTRQLSDFVHNFSHYQLLVTPWLIEIETNAAQVADRDDQGWYRYDEAIQLGLPAPVRKLLLQIWEST